MAALTRLVKPSFASHSPISYLSRCLYSGIASESNSHAASAYTPHLGPKPNLSVKDPKDRNVQWVFLGSPGVGKGTYASRLSNLLGVPHIATGDLVREELAASGPLSQQVLLLYITDFSLRSAPLILLQSHFFSHWLCCVLQLSEIVNQGKLVSDEIIINLLSKRLEAGESKGELGFILDGFPRTMRQAVSVFSCWN